MEKEQKCFTTRQKDVQKQSIMSDVWHFIITKLQSLDSNRAFLSNCQWTCTEKVVRVTWIYKTRTVFPAALRTVSVRLCESCESLWATNYLLVICYQVSTSGVRHLPHAVVCRLRYRDRSPVWFQRQLSNWIHEQHSLSERINTRIAAGQQIQKKAVVSILKIMKIANGLVLYTVESRIRELQLEFQLEALVEWKWEFCRRGGFEAVGNTVGNTGYLITFD